MTRFRQVFLLAFFLLSALVASVPATAQTISERSANQDSEMKDMLKKQAKAANLKRQADLKRDTDRLLELATQLKNHVDKTNENILSLDVIKKAEEIEKLAHSVREKMKADNFATPTP